MMSVNVKRVYAAIRETEGRNWIDVSCLDVLPELARGKAENYDRKDPGYAAVNRLVRIAELFLSDAPPPPAPPLEAPKSAPAPRPAGRRAKSGPVVIDGIDCTAAIKEMEKARTGFATPNSWLANPAYARKDKRMADQIGVAMTSALAYGEPVTIAADDDGPAIIVRRRAA